jgi:recombination protein RecA
MAKKLDELLKKNSDPKATKMAKLAEACAKLQAKFGKENVNYLGNKKAEKTPRIPSGSMAIDRVTGGGYPLGRIIEISGGPSAGKTTACYHAIAEAQKMYPDDFCGFIDSEYSADWSYAESLGVDTESVMISQPDDGHDAFGILQGMIEAGARLVVVDSVAAMLPKEEAEEDDYAHQGMALQARMMSKGLRKLTSIAGKHQCVVIFTNQLRDNVGVLWGEKTQTTGGKALQYYSSIRLKFTRVGKVEEKDGDEKIATAIETKVESVKNKTYRPYLRDKFTVVFGKGIDNDAGIIETAISEGVIKKKGGWYSIDGSNVAQGLPALKEYLDTNHSVYERIKKETLEAIKPDEDELIDSGANDADSMTDDEIAEKVMNDNTEVGEV